MVRVENVGGTQMRGCSDTFGVVLYLGHLSPHQESQIHRKYNSLPPTVTASAISLSYWRYRCSYDVGTHQCHQQVLCGPRITVIAATALDMNIGNTETANSGLIKKRCGMYWHKAAPIFPTVICKARETGVTALHVFRKFKVDFLT